MWLTLTVGESKDGQNVHFRWSDLGAPLTLPGCTSSAAATHSWAATMCERPRIASSSAGAAARDGERGPELAQRRPSLERVGVLAGARPADGPSGCNPSAPSCRCSPCPSSSPRRRNRCLPTLLARLALPPRSPPTGCSLCMTGDHWTLRWKLFLMAAKRQRSAAQRGGGQELALPAVPMCAEAREGPRSRSGRRLVVEPADLRCLAGPHGPTLPSCGGFGAPG